MKIEAIDIQNIAGHQSIQLPEELRINDSKVYITKMGDVLYIIPFHTPWKSFFDSLPGFSEDFMDNRDQSGQQKRESFD
jgi:antitoxin VapB